MNKKIDNTYLNQYTDNAIKRGYEIYDEWIDQKHTSRKIVASAHSAVKVFKKRKTMAAFVEVLAYIFAIDTRIKEKYNNILRCLFSYFSWRRETRALSTLKTELNIPLGVMDIRNLIAVEIEKLAQKLEDGWDEDGSDDEAHGGKHNGKGEEEANAEKKETEDTDKEKPEAEELSDKEETEKDSEQKDEEPVEEAVQEEVKEAIGEQEEAAEAQNVESEKTAADKKEEPEPAKHDNLKELKEENNGPDEISEPSIDKKEVQAYNDAVDSPPIYEETVSEGSKEKVSLIDEMVIDNMIKGDKNIIGYRRIDEAERNKKADVLQDAVESQSEKNKSADKDAYLYDKIIVTDKGEAQQTLNAASLKQAEKVSKTKPEQPKETIQNNNNVNYAKQELKPLSEKPQSQSDNLNVDLENNIAYALNTNMSLESKMSLIRMKEEQMREHIRITFEELGMNDTVDVLRVSEPDEVSPPSAVQSRK